MSSPYVIALLVEAGIVAALAPKIEDPALLIFMLLQFAVHFATATILYRHQKALEWFQNHIRLETSKLPDGAPTDMGRKDNKE